MNEICEVCFVLVDFSVSSEKMFVKIVMSRLDLHGSMLNYTHNSKQSLLVCSLMCCVHFKTSNDDYMKRGTKGLVWKKVKIRDSISTKKVPIPHHWWTLKFSNFFCFNLYSISQREKELKFTRKTNTHIHTNTIVTRNINASIKSWKNTNTHNREEKYIESNMTSPMLLTPKSFILREEERLSWRDLRGYWGKCNVSYCLGWFCIVQETWTRGFCLLCANDNMSTAVCVYNIAQLTNLVVFRRGEWININDITYEKKWWSKG